LGAVSVATAVVMPGSVANRVARRDANSGTRIDVEHPTGFFTVDVDFEAGTPPRVRRSALLRTARKLMRGEVFVPGSIWRRA
jgi:4-oxalomesaconate tautomerase